MKRSEDKRAKACRLHEAKRCQIKDYRKIKKIAV
jgi:hypothetical protein